MNNVNDMHERAKYSKQVNEYVDKLNGEDIIELTEYNNCKYDRYYFNCKTDTLYLYTRHKYKVVKPLSRSSGIKDSFSNGLMNIVALIDINGKAHSLSYNKLIRELKEISEII